MPKISIIMPVYNKQQYLRRSLDSVLNQGFSDFELIAIDDGSTDNSLKILEEYSSRDSRIKLIHTENQGVSHARNVGLDHIEGEFITFVDADDELKQEYLSSLYKDYVNSGADIVIHGITKVTADGKMLETQKSVYNAGFYEMSELMPEFAVIQKNTGIFGFCVSKLFSAELSNHIRFDEKLKLAEDFDYYLKIYEKTHSVYLDYQSNYLYYQDLAGSSVDVEDDGIDYASQLIINLRYREFLKKMNCYSGKNKNNVDQVISLNAFNVLFYSDETDFSEKCVFVLNTIDDAVDLQSMSRFKKTVLNAVIKGNFQVGRLLIKSYKAARAIKRKFS